MGAVSIHERLSGVSEYEPYGPSDFLLTCLCAYIACVPVRMHCRWTENMRSEHVLSAELRKAPEGDLHCIEAADSVVRVCSRNFGCSNHLWFVANFSTFSGLREIA